MTTSGLWGRIRALIGQRLSFSKTVDENQNSTLYSIPLKTIQGEKTNLSQYRGQILLIVNVASRCGFTPQYQDLQMLYESYHEQGVSVLGFPCNQFLHQEPGNATEIQQFASSCFRVTFPLFEKLNVRKPAQSPLYAYLSQHIQKKTWGVFIPWNFTKILVDRHGHVLKRYLPTTSMNTIRKDIDELLRKQ